MSRARSSPLLDLFARLDRAGRFEEGSPPAYALAQWPPRAYAALARPDSLTSLAVGIRRCGRARGREGVRASRARLALSVCRLPGTGDRTSSRSGAAAGARRHPDRRKVRNRHNLDSAHRDLALEAASGIQPPRRLQRLLVLAGAIAVAAGGGAGIALAVHDGHGHQSSVPPSAHAFSHCRRAAGRPWTGSVSGDGLSCPNACRISIKDGRTIALKATHANGSTFGRWSLAACGTKETCKLTVTRSLTITATFSPASHVRPLQLSPPTGLRAAVVSANEVDLPGLSRAERQPWSAT